MSAATNSLAWVGKHSEIAGIGQPNSSKIILHYPFARMKCQSRRLAEPHLIRVATYLAARTPEKSTRLLADARMQKSVG